jgi:hypothetical protein
MSFASQSAETTSAAQTLTLTNIGTVNATVSSISSGNSDFAVTPPAPSVTLAPSKSFPTTV